MKLIPNINAARFIRRNKIPVEELDSVRCDNCDFEFKGHYCPSCGQEVAEFNRPFGFVLYDFAGNFFAFDTRFFQTFWHLLSRPGFLTAEFFKGRRVRYSPPFRIFVFLSFAVFLLLQILTERSLDKIPEITTEKQIGQVDLNSGIHLKTSIISDGTFDEKLKMFQDSTEAVAKLNTDSIESEEDLNFDLAAIGSGNLRSRLNNKADQLEIKLKRTTDKADRDKLSLYIAMCRTPEMAISNIMKYMSWTFFILLPVFALILKLFYLRRKQFYIRHLIFSIHLHSFLFFVLIIIAILKLIFNSGMTGVSMILLFTFPVYFIVALHKFYGQSFGKVILKFAGISFIYNIFLWSAVLIVITRIFGII